MTKGIRNIWIAGAAGQLGTAVRDQFGRDARFNIFTTERGDIDWKDERTVLGIAEALEPAFLINCIAYTDVDGAETHQAEAMEANYKLVQEMAFANLEHTLPIIHISTDHVFGGFGKIHQQPFTEEDFPAPANYYGLTKYLGEFWLHDFDPQTYILRTSWLYGPQDWAKKNFYKSIHQAGLKGGPLRVVEDEVGSPTSTFTLARVIYQIVLDYETPQQLPFGIYHVADEGEVSRYDFAREILSLDPRTKDVEITPCKQADLNLPAPRPYYSALSTHKIQNYYPHLIRPWQKALKEVYDFDNK